VFIGQHGSWNRKPHSGYKLVFVPFSQRQAERSAAGRADRLPEQGWQGQGRPVGVAVDKQGAILLADDVGNIIWRVAPSAKTASR
jgi:glucose/arabinose dehydrogenase